MLFLASFLTLMGLGIAEYGSYYSVKSALQQAARDGALEAIKSSGTNANVQSAVDVSMANCGLQTSGYTVTLSPSNMLGLPTGQSISVTVQCVWANVGLHALPPGMTNISPTQVISESVVMNRE